MALVLAYRLTRIASQPPNSPVAAPAAPSATADTLHRSTDVMTPNPNTPPDDPMLAKRQILIGVPIDDECARITIAKLLFLNMQDSNAPITLYINSPGGSVTASIAILDTITGLHAPVHTYSAGICQGTALLVLAVGSHGHRLATSDSVLSIEPTDLASANPDARASFYRDKLNEKMATTLSTHTKLTHDQALEALDKGRLFTPQEALSTGIVDALTSASIRQQ